MEVTLYMSNLMMASESILSKQNDRETVELLKSRVKQSQAFKKLIEQEIELINQQLQSIKSEQE